MSQRLSAILGFAFILASVFSSECFAAPPEETVRKPPLRVPLISLPVASRISEPPIIVVPLATPPDETVSTPLLIVTAFEDRILEAPRADAQSLSDVVTGNLVKKIEAQGWSLNPGRYVGVAPGEAVSDEDFKEQLETLNEELETLNVQARDLEQTIARNVVEILSV